MVIYKKTQGSGNVSDHRSSDKDRMMPKTKPTGPTRDRVRRLSKTRKGGDNVLEKHLGKGESAGMRAMMLVLDDETPKRVKSRAYGDKLKGRETKVGKSNAARAAKALDKGLSK